MECEVQHAFLKNVPVILVCRKISKREEKKKIIWASSQSPFFHICGGVFAVHGYFVFNSVSERKGVHGREGHFCPTHWLLPKLTIFY